MNHHPLHLDAHYAEETTDFGKNVVVGNYIYSLLLGMSVPDVSGKAIANLEVESLQARRADLPRRHDLRRDRGARQDASRSPRTTAASSTSRPRGYNQDGTVVCVFRRKVMVPKRSYGDARGGEQPGRPGARRGA